MLHKIQLFPRKYVTDAWDGTQQAIRALFPTVTPGQAQEKDAADVQEVQSKWLSYFEELEDPRGTK